MITTLKDLKSNKTAGNILHLICCVNFILFLYQANSSRMSTTSKQLSMLIPTYEKRVAHHINGNREVTKTLFAHFKKKCANRTH